VKGILFHRRAANETVQTWLQTLREGIPQTLKVWYNSGLLTIATSGARKLNLVYLANEVAQQSRVRRKDEFPRAFGEVIAEAMGIAYRGSTVDIQNKLRRVVDVWRSRNVFEPTVLADIDKRLDGI